MSNPFDYVNEIMQGKKNLITDAETEAGYVPFLVNRALSQHFDCVMYANEMNTRHTIDKKLQNDYLLNTIRSKKRPFAKWAKAEKIADVKSVATYYGISQMKAAEIMKIHSDEDLKYIRSKVDIGG